MTTKDATDKLIPLELTRDDLGWLRAFLNEGRVSADHDYKKVESLHNALAIGAAQDALRSEHARMTKIVDEINRLLAVIDKHESCARKIAAMTPPVA
jgi:hypothetical protein